LGRMLAMAAVIQIDSLQESGSIGGL
jgi:hypothetical protein